MSLALHMDGIRGMTFKHSHCAQSRFWIERFSVVVDRGQHGQSDQSAITRFLCWSLSTTTLKPPLYFVYSVSVTSCSSVCYNAECSFSKAAYRFFLFSLLKPCSVCILGLCLCTSYSLLFFPFLHISVFVCTCLLPAFTSAGEQRGIMWSPPSHSFVA